jgi:hypothetical protein
MKPNHRREHPQILCRNSVPHRIGCLKDHVTVMRAEIKECCLRMEATDEDPKEMMRILQRTLDLRREVWETRRTIEDLEFQYPARN